MVSAKRAPVRPRVVSPESGEALPLEEEVQALVAAGATGVVYLVGPAGSGKTTALEHLAAVLPPGTPVELRDAPGSPGGDEPAPGRLVVCAASPPARPRGAVYRLAPWGNDELIEYLLAVHREHCASVMARVRGPGRELLQGIPELCRVVLDRLAEDPSIPDARQALQRYLQTQIAHAGLLERVRQECVNALALAGAGGEPAPSPALQAVILLPGVGRVLRHFEVQLLLAVGRLAEDLRAGAASDCLARRLPRRLVWEVAGEITGDVRALQTLRGLVVGPPKFHAMTASLLHAADPGWVPEPGRVPVLAGAYLELAAWPEVRLPNAYLVEIDFRHADLRGADLHGADASGADLGHARLSGAGLHGFKAVGANLAGANLAAARAVRSGWKSANLAGANLQGATLTDASLREANLTGAVFTGADLTGVFLSRAEIREADFSGARLDGAHLAGLRLREADCRGASFLGADLSGCDLEGMDLAGADCGGANLANALLTGTVLADANLRGACLRGAGLGDVNLERACLRDADLRGATFHMGSSRSGLLFTPIASEGTRTGFYTDDADEQNFKAPEEIRKANLCGADLRGANIGEVDFYLVDLRGALYDADQERHFRRCRAILESRADG